MESMKDIVPTKPVAPYIGGKSRLSKIIVGYINSIPHMTYAEPFVGMGGIFLRRNKKPKAEVINDYSREVSNLFRILQRHYPEFISTLRFRITSRSEFERLVGENPKTLTDMELAARFLYLQKTAFGGKVSGKNFGVDRTRSGRFNLSTLEPMLADVYERLSGVTIECLDYKAFIQRYDSPHTLFYLDPPYYMCESDYGRDLFNRDEFSKMATLLEGIEGTFILSLNDHKYVRETFKVFHICEVETLYTIGKQSNKKTGELIISNRPLSNAL